MEQKRVTKYPMTDRGCYLRVVVALKSLILLMLLVSKRNVV